MSCIYILTPLFAVALQQSWASLGTSADEEHWARGNILSWSVWRKVAQFFASPQFIRISSYMPGTHLQFGGEKQANRTPQTWWYVYPAYWHSR